ncbi:MAG TPA: F0F1 ATP synthase subunit delta [Candidatus Paceibacterota bacterium]
MKFTTKQYAELLDRAMDKVRGDDARNTVMKEFVKMLTNDGKISKLPEILAHFGAFWNKRHDIVDISIEAADEKDAKFPKEFAGKKVSLKVLENKALLGGSILRIGDYLIDTSVRSKINALRN